MVVSVEGVGVSVDFGAVVDELGNRGMRELLLHLVESGRIKDPVAAAKIEIVQYRLTYTDDQSHSSPQRRTKAQAALDRTIDLQKKLIQQHPEHEQQHDNDRDRVVRNRAAAGQGGYAGAAPAL